MGKARYILTFALWLGLGSVTYGQAAGGGGSGAANSPPTLKISPSTVQVSMKAINAATGPVRIPVKFTVTGNPLPARINPNVAGVGPIPPGYFSRDMAG